MTKKFVNHDFGTELVSYIDGLVDKDDYYTATILQNSLIEFVLKMAIKKLTPDDRTFEQYYKTDIRFFDLINFWYLLDDDSALYRKLDKYRKNRNDLIHNVLQQCSLIDFKKQAKGTYVLGEKLIKDMQSKNYFSSLSNGYKGKTSPIYYRKKRGAKLKRSFV